MKFDPEKLQTIFEKTDGCCHICHKRLAYSHYGKHDAKSSWHVDHSNPKAKGGTNRLCNLLPACIPCNLSKGTSSTRKVRRLNGTSRAPLSRHKKDAVRDENALTGAIIGGLVGLVAGPAGALLGLTIGGIIGQENSPRNK